MTNLGVHILMPRDAAKRLFADKRDDAVRGFVDDFRQDAENQSNGWVLETGEAWRIIHRCLTDGTLDPTAGEFPLNHCILGGRHLHQGDDFFVALTRPDMTAHVAGAVTEIDRRWLENRYSELPGEVTLDGVDFEAIWTKLQDIGKFFDAARGQHAAVVFAADA